MGQRAKVIDMPNRDATPQVDVSTPWGALGFVSERDMLVDDLRTLDSRVRAAATPASALAALVLRKQGVLEQIKALDAGDDDDDAILDDSDDEAWDA